ncbi:hypothetical protein CDAR_590271 [Caerostris darwini]|uniref:Uncharacterized protein n=1 Tax=Caerostris darwini TaxID=1538125 RepID=A0AAV4NRH1_9ARAC|nr:hypothetical protein CDAR_590271 [Caerostris darwini]
MIAGARRSEPRGAQINEPSVTSAELKIALWSAGKGRWPPLSPALKAGGNELKELDDGQGGCRKACKIAPESSIFKTFPASLCARWVTPVPNKEGTELMGSLLGLQGRVVAF